MTEQIRLRHPDLPGNPVNRKSETRRRADVPSASRKRAGQAPTPLVMGTRSEADGTSSDIRATGLFLIRCCWSAKMRAMERQRRVVIFRVAFVGDIQRAAIRLQIQRVVQ